MYQDRLISSLIAALAAVIGAIVAGAFGQDGVLGYVSSGVCAFLFFFLLSSLLARAKRRCRERGQCLPGGKEAVQGKMVVKNEIPVVLFPNRIDNVLLKTYYEINHLKQLYRQGWLKRKVPTASCETVAEHSFGVAVLALLLKDPVVAEGSERFKAVKMALVHDFGEVYAGDYTPGEIPLEEKRRRELDSVMKIFGKHDPQDFVELWREYEEGTSPVARFVADLDKLEMRLQACIYEGQGLGPLDDFFQDGARCSSAYMQEMFDTMDRVRSTRKPC